MIEFGGYDKMHVRLVPLLDFLANDEMVRFWNK